VAQKRYFEGRIMSYETILVETRGNVGLITLNRPKALNALNSTLMMELNAALKIFDKDKNIGAMVITGNEKAFAAGADIKEMLGKTYPDTFLDDLITPWEEMASRCERLCIRGWL
jgi:enoyl-CoA hydratase